VGPVAGLGAGCQRLAVTVLAVLAMAILVPVAASGCGGSRVSVIGVKQPSASVPYNGGGA